MPSSRVLTLALARSVAVVGIDAGDSIAPLSTRQNLIKFHTLNKY